MEEVVQVVEEKIVEPVVKAVKSLVGCGHINKHFHGVSGKLEDLVCTLPEGHEGDHSAPTQALRQVEDNFETALAVEAGAKKFTIAGKLYLTVNEDGFWSDAAGVLASEIKPDLDGFATLQKAKNAAK